MIKVQENYTNGKKSDHKQKYRWIEQQKQHNTNKTLSKTVEE